MCALLPANLSQPPSAGFSLEQANPRRCAEVVVFKRFRRLWLVLGQGSLQRSAEAAFGGMWKQAFRLSESCNHFPNYSFDAEGGLVQNFIEKPKSGARFPVRVPTQFMRTFIICWVTAQIVQGP